MATIADGRTIPFDWYSDPAVLRLERERIFRRTWQYAGRVDQVAEAGAFFTCDLGGVPIVVVRGDDGDLRAFLNVCRHRGSLVCEGEGKRASLQCPYHAWTYGLDGSLRAAPRSERVPGFEKEGLGLVPAAVGSVGTVRLRQPGCGGRAARRHARRAARRSSPRPASTSTRCAFSSARAGTSTRRTGRSAARTTSSATTARSPTRTSRRSSTSRSTRTCSRRAACSRRSTGRCGRRGRATSTRAARWNGASSTSSGRT